MKTPPLPPDETSRQASLAALHILDTPMEERFERITRLAKRSFNVPIVAISLIDNSRQWFKSVQGLPVNETPRDVSFCGHAILDNDTMVVLDAMLDPRFHDNPLVTGDPSIRFYAGCPVHAPDGAAIGTLCLIDRVPRQLDSHDLQALKDLAHMVENEIQIKTAESRHTHLVTELNEVKLRAAVDPLTRLWNRSAITELLVRERAQTVRENTSLAVIFIDFDHFKQVNDRNTHAAGDALLREGAARLNATLRPMDALGRYGGDELIAVLPDCTMEEVKLIGERLRSVIAQTPIEIPGSVIKASISGGVAYDQAGAATDIERLIAIADQALYQAKAGGRNRVEFGLADSTRT